MATYTVTTLVDEEDAGASVASPGGAGLSLREAIALARGGDTVTFADGLAAGEINLTLGQVEVEKPRGSGDLVIDGDLDDDGRPDITLDAQGASRVMEIAPDVDAVTRTQNTPVVIDGLIFTGGVASGGGGINVRETDFTLRNSEVYGNSASVSGGGIAINNTFGGPAVTDYSIENSIIRDNEAQDGAGIIYRRAELAITNSLIEGNEATGGYAGGIRGYDARDLTIVNSTLQGNTVTGTDDFIRAGGILVASIVATADVTLRNSTITGNVAVGGTQTTGGVRTIGEDLIVENSILTGNSGGGAASDVGSDVTSSNGANIFGQSSVTGAVAGDMVGIGAAEVFEEVYTIGGGGGGITGTIIRAGALNDNGGNSQTVGLLATGPALDAGAPLTLYGPGEDRVIGTADDDIILTDQRGPGYGRTVWLTDGGKDIGAFEVQSLPVVFTSGDDIVDLNFFDLDRFFGTTDALAGDDRVTLSEYQNTGVPFYGGEGDDLIRGSGSGDEIHGDAGDDRLLGFSGADRLIGGRGEDEILGGSGEDELRGGAASDTLLGGNNNDLVVGGSGDDWLFGGRGWDELVGGTGRDVMQGGNGNDIFDFNWLAESRPGAVNRDLIRGFEGIGGPGGDRIDLSGIDADAGGGDDAFTFIGTSGFSGHGQLRVFSQAGLTVVAGNTRGDRDADFEIAVDDGSVRPGAWDVADFIV